MSLWTGLKNLKIKQHYSITKLRSGTIHHVIYCLHTDQLKKSENRTLNWFSAHYARRYDDISNQSDHLLLSAQVSFVERSSLVIKKSVVVPVSVTGVRYNSLL